MVSCCCSQGSMQCDRSAGLPCAGRVLIRADDLACSGWALKSVDDKAWPGTPHHLGLVKISRDGRDRRPDTGADFAMTCLEEGGVRRPYLHDQC